jgi:acetyl-CoA acetyltransferase
MMFAAQGVMSGTQDIVLAAGIESMTRVPMGSTSMLFKKEGMWARTKARVWRRLIPALCSPFMALKCCQEIRLHPRRPGPVCAESNQKANYRDAKALSTKSFAWKSTRQEGNVVHNRR